MSTNLSELFRVVGIVTLVLTGAAMLALILAAVFAGNVERKGKDGL